MWTFKNSKDVADSLGLIPHPEEGYFIETFRSGATPMKSQGQTDVDVESRYKTSTPESDLLQTPITSTNKAKTSTSGSDSLKKSSPFTYEALTLAPGRESRRADGDIRRNCLTSIIFMPTVNKVMPLAVNYSDHVHYFHGGCPFEYTIYDPRTGRLFIETLGCDVRGGQKLQVPVPGGFWKGGRVVKTTECDFSLIGEGVAPGFDFHDFSWVTKSDLSSVKDLNHRFILSKFPHENVDELSGKEVEDAIRYYEGNP